MLRPMPRLVQGAVTACKTYTQAAPGSASAPWRCALDLPNSFLPGDGHPLQVVCQGATAVEASEHACRLAFAQLLLRNPSQVILRPSHWNVSPDALLAQLPGIDRVHQALPVHTRPRARVSGAAVATMESSERDAAVSDVMRKCLRTYGGRFDPSCAALKFRTQFNT